MGILGLSKLIADIAPLAVKENEIKNFFGKSAASICHEVMSLFFSTIFVFMLFHRHRLSFFVGNTHDFILMC